MDVPLACLLACSVLQKKRTADASAPDPGLPSPLQKCCWESTTLARSIFSSAKRQIQIVWVRAFVHCSALSGKAALRKAARLLVATVSDKALRAHAGGIRALPKPALAVWTPWVLDLHVGESLLANAAAEYGNIEVERTAYG